MGTIISTFFLIRAGCWFDVHGARSALIAASLMLGMSILFLAVVDLASDHVATLIGINGSAIAFSLMVFGYFGFRSSGQGVMTSASRNLLLLWFERRRGLVSGVSGVFVSLCFWLVRNGPGVCSLQPDNQPATSWMRLQLTLKTAIL